MYVRIGLLRRGPGGRGGGTNDMRLSLHAAPARITGMAAAHGHRPPAHRCPRHEHRDRRLDELGPLPTKRRLEMVLGPRPGHFLKWRPMEVPTAPLLLRMDMGPSFSAFQTVPSTLRKWGSSVVCTAFRSSTTTFLSMERGGKLEATIPTQNYDMEPQKTQTLVRG